MYRDSHKYVCDNHMCDGSLHVNVSVIDTEIKQVFMEESSKDEFVATENNAETLKEVHM